jgi:ArsR family transcriptional regulator
MENKHLDYIRVFKAFCDETRLKVLELLQSGEKCACVLLEQVKVGQPTLSHHMKILVESGIVNARKEGRWMHYSINEDCCKDIVLMVQEMITVKRIPCCTIILAKGNLHEQYN